MHIKVSSSLTFGQLQDSLLTQVTKAILADLDWEKILALPPKQRDERIKKELQDNWPDLNKVVINFE